MLIIAKNKLTLILVLTPHFNSALIEANLEHMLNSGFLFRRGRNKDILDKMPVGFKKWKLPFL
jgi:hypothetical protein